MPLNQFRARHFGQYHFLALKMFGGFIPAEETQEGGHFWDYKHYRKQLERLSKIADERLYPKQAVPIIEELEEIPVDIDEIKKLAGEPQTKGTLRLTPQIDYALLYQQIADIRTYLDKVEQNRLKLMEQDDEAAFLLLIH